MITVVFSTREHNGAHIDHLKKTSGLDKNLTVIEWINTGDKSLTFIYDKVLKDSKDDIVVFCHDDITIGTKNWGQKLIALYKNNPEYGVLGVAGSKLMPESGKWWEVKSKMYGRVSHTSEGKTWLSAYSDDIANKIEEVVVLDGVFFSVMKSRLKKDFDTTVEGFHFYDVDFSFSNHLAGVKIGVHTNIRINHASIGATNDAWEENRIKFVEKFNEKLPINLKETFVNRKLKVLIGCLNFRDYTGSELYVYELAKSLIEQGCDVSVCSLSGGELSKKAKKLGIKIFNLNEPPTYKLGDGKWSIIQGDKLIPSVVNTLYKLNDEKFDVLHLNHKPVTEHLLRLYPDTPTICTIHSEIIDLEKPVINDNIKKYIAIRPEIKDFLINDFGIDKSKIEVLYNPIDQERFKNVNMPKNSKKRILFVGTIDYLRKDTILDLIETTKINDNELWIVGKENGVEISELIDGQGHVKYFPPTPLIEKYVKQCDETASIMLGRTTIEGWLCGKKGWVYNVDNSGAISDKKLLDIPADLDKFKSRRVASAVKEFYKEIIY